MTKPRLTVVAAALCLLVLSVPASAQKEPTELTIEAHDGGGAYWFQIAGDSARNPNLNLVPGESYRITLQNRGNAPHNFHIDAAATPIIGPGENATIDFTVPSTAGDISYWCDPHRSIGMEGVAVTTQDDKDTPGPGLPVLVASLIGVAGWTTRRRNRRG